MKKTPDSTRIKDDTSIRQITQHAEQQRKLSGKKPLPIDPETATELWKLWTALETDEAEIELFAAVENDKIVFHEPAPLHVHDNEIRFGKTKIRITLESAKA